MPWAVDTGHPVPDTWLSLALFALTPVVFAASFIATYWLVTAATAMVFDLTSRLCGMAAKMARTRRG